MYVCMYVLQMSRLKDQQLEAAHACHRKHMPSLPAPPTSSSSSSSSNGWGQAMFKAFINKLSEEVGGSFIHIYIYISYAHTYIYLHATIVCLFDYLFLTLLRVRIFSDL